MNVACGEELAGDLEIVRRFLVAAAPAVVLAENARGRLLFAVLLQHFRGAHGLIALEEQLGGLREATAPQRHLRRGDMAAALFEHDLRALEFARLVVQLAGLEDERLQLARVLRILAGAGAGALFEDHRFERVGGFLPRLAANEGVRGLALEAGFAIAGARAAEVAGLLEEFARHRHASRGEETIGGAFAVALRREDRSGRLVVAGLQMQLGGLEEAVLVVTDLGRAHELAGLDEVIGGGIEDAVLEAQLGGLVELALLRQRMRGALDLARRAAIEARKLGALVRLGVRLDAPSRRQLDASGEQRRHDQREARAERIPRQVPVDHGAAVGHAGLLAELLDLLATGADARIVVRAARQIETGAARADQREAREQDEALHERTNQRASPRGLRASAASGHPSPARAVSAGARGVLRRDA